MHSREENIEQFSKIKAQMGGKYEMRLKRAGCESLVLIHQAGWGSVAILISVMKHRAQFPYNTNNFLFGLGRVNF